MWWTCVTLLLFSCIYLFTHLVRLESLCNYKHGCTGDWAGVRCPPGEILWVQRLVEARGCLGRGKSPRHMACLPPEAEGLYLPFLTLIKHALGPRHFWCINLGHWKFNLVLLTLELFQAICHCQYFQNSKRCERGARAGRVAVDSPLWKNTMTIFCFKCLLFFSCQGLINNQKNMPRDRNYKISESWNRH